MKPKIFLQLKSSLFNRSKLFALALCYLIMNWGVYFIIMYICLLVLIHELEISQCIIRKQSSCPHSVFLQYLIEILKRILARIVHFYCIKTYLHNPNKCLRDLPFGQGHRQCVSPFFFTESTHVNPSGHLLEVIYSL